MAIHATREHCFREWLQSHETVRICGLDVALKPHPRLKGAPQCIVKGQASVFWLQQVPQGNTWLLKIFTPGRRPTDAYLQGVARCLPGAPAFFTCTQRRSLTSRHVDLGASSYRNPALTELLEGAVMMPKVPGTTWASVADDLRAGVVDLAIVQRLRLALALAQCVDLLEAGTCSHRDLSSSNVFVSPDVRVYLIDFDCLYHPSLPFQANTTLGTMGYLAPFRITTDSVAEAAWSWRPCADRFSLAMLIAEMLLIGPDTPAIHEDGTLFGQTQIDQAGNSFVREMIGRLTRVSRLLGPLLQRAFSSLTFEACPSPGDWIAALRHVLKRVDAEHCPDHATSRQSRPIRIQCAECGAPFSMAQAKRDHLQAQGKSVLCKSCLGRQLTRSSVTRAQRKSAFPQVSCEHCRRTFLTSRQKLDDLRHRGRPILCPACLSTQLKKWRAEQTEHQGSYPYVTCTVCGDRFPLRQQKLDELTAEGKAILCRTCLKTKHEGRTDVHVPRTESNVKPRHFMRRIFYGHSI